MSIFLMFSGQTVFAQGAAATPQHLLTAMTEYGKSAQLKDITVCHMHTEGKASYTEPECEGIFRLVLINVIYSIICFKINDQNQ